MNEKIRRAIESEFNLGGSDGIPDINSIDGATIIQANSIEDLKKQMRAAGINNPDELIGGVLKDKEAMDLLKRVGLKTDKTPWDLIRTMASFNTNSYVLNIAKAERRDPAEVLEELLKKSTSILGAAIEANEQIFGGNPKTEDIMAQLLMAVDILVRETNGAGKAKVAKPTERTFADIMKDLINRSK